MRARPVLILLALLSLAPALPGAAAAAATQPVVVARDGSLPLSALEGEDGQLCLSLAVRPSAEREACADPATGVILTGDGDGNGTPLGAAVLASATRIEVRRGGRLLAAGATITGETYRGAGAGQVRFALVRLPPHTSLTGLRVRALDARGALLAVVTQYDGGPLTTHRGVLLSGRSGATSWALRTSTVTRSSPSIVDPARETVQHCLGVDIRDFLSDELHCRPVSGEDQLLDAALEGAAGTPQLTDICGVRFRLLHGAAAAGTRAVQVELGDGRRVTARTAPYPAAGTVAYALPIDAVTAVRAVRLTGAGGAVRTVALRESPLAVGCRLQDAGLQADAGITSFDPSESVGSLFGRTPAVVPAGPVAEIAGSPAFRVADGPDGRLCVATAGRPFQSISCAPVTSGYGDLVVSVDSFDRPRAFVQVVPAAVAQVRLGRRTGALRTVATVAAEAYTGAYAGKVRFLSTRIAGFGDAQRIEYLDAAGNILHREVPGPDDPPATELEAPRVFGPRRVAGAPGRPSLWQTTVRGGFVSGAPCLALTDGPSPGRLSRCQTDRRGRLSVIVQASCSTRRLTVALIAGAGSRASLTTTGGTPSAVGLRGGLGLLTLAPGDGVRDVAVSLPVGRTRHVPLRAPAGAEQCGWRSIITVPDIEKRASGPAPESGEHQV